MSTLSIPSWGCAPTPETLNAKLRVSKDGSQLEPIKLDRKNILFGRKSDLCDITLDHHTISRRHAVTLHRNDGTLHIMDVGSAQGIDITLYLSMRMPDYQLINVFSFFSFLSIFSSSIYFFNVFFIYGRYICEWNSFKTKYSTTTK